MNRSSRIVGDYDDWFENIRFTTHRKTYTLNIDGLVIGEQNGDVMTHNPNEKGDDNDGQKHPDTNVRIQQDLRHVYRKLSKVYHCVSIENKAVASFKKIHTEGNCSHDMEKMKNK